MYINPFIAGALSVIFIEVMFLIIFVAHNMRVVVKDADHDSEVYEQSENDHNQDIK